MVYSAQMPMYPPPGSVGMPVNRPPILAMMPTPLTGNQKMFFIASGILYIIWGVLSIGLEIAILSYSYFSYYRGFWAGGFLVGSGISLLVVGGRGTFVLTRLTTLFAIALVFTILGMITSIINYTTSPYWDTVESSQLKIVILAVMIVAIIHTVVNMVVANKVHQKAVTESNTHGPGRH